MRKKLLYRQVAKLVCALIAPLLTFFIVSCSDEDNTFKADISPSSFSFKPVTGGAMMYYRLPDDPQIVGIHARYKDAYGKEILRTGSHLCDSLELPGFNKAEQNISVSLTVFHQDGTESEPVKASFSTYDSGPIAFIKNADVMSNWDGFTVKYETPAGTKGMVHVFYLGTDPLTGKPDTLLINSFNLEETSEPVYRNFTIKQDVKTPIVVLRAEDYRGNMVAEETYTGVECMEKTKLNPDKFSFYCDNAVIDTMNTLSLVAPKYLFDGDSKGLFNYEVSGMSTRIHSFIAGPNAEGPNAHPMYIDMKNNHVTGSVRLYSIIQSSQGPIWIVYSQWLMFFDDTPMYPCNIDIYGAKDDGDHTAMESKDMEKLQWVKLSNYSQDKNTPYEKRWCAHTSCNSYPKVQTYEELLEMDPDYVDILIPAEGQKDGYRYLKLVVNETFEKVQGNIGGPWDGYVTFSELEVYTKKEE